MRATRVELLFVLASLLALPVLAGERAVIVLTDGQTFEGDARPLPDGGVEVTIDLSSGGTQTLLLDALAIERIEPLDAKREEAVAEAIVRLVDGRELRGEAIVRRSEVVVRGAHGQVVVARGDVVSVSAVLPEPARTLADADTGLILPLPAGWVPDEAAGVGERLRLVREDGRASISVLLRPLPAGSGGAAIDLERIRAALQHDVGGSADLRRAEDGRWRVRDSAHDPAVPGTWPMHLLGTVELFDDHVLFFRALADGAEPLDPTLQAALDEVVTKRAVLREGRSRDGTMFRDPAARLFVEAPAGFRIGQPAERPDGVFAQVTSPGEPSASLVLQLVDDTDAKNALLDLLEGPAEASDEVTLGGTTVFRARREGERGVTLRAAAGVIAIMARAPTPEQLARLTGSVVVFDPGATASELDAAERLLPLLTRARRALDDDDAATALELVDLVLGQRPEDPDALTLRCAALRARGDAAATLEALDDAWVNTGRPWVGQELARGLLERSRAQAAAGEHAAALEAIERAAEVWPDEDVTAATITVMTTGAQRSFDAGEPLVAFARYARLRELVGSHPQVDAGEAALRLRAGQAALAEGDTRTARREARRAYTLGAADDDVNRLYSQAEHLDYTQAVREARARAHGPGRQGGFSFGIPPTQNRRSSRIKPTAFNRPGERGNRVRGVNYTGERSRRVRPQREGRGRRVRPPQPSGGGRRVRSNGSFLFG